jgi:Flp pilus assembly protein TadG
MSAIRIAIINLLRNVRRFITVAHGNVAIIFALTLIPLLAFVGVAIDYSRANALKAGMQEALDATALMVSKNAATMTAAQIQHTAQSYFLAQFHHPQVNEVRVTATYSSAQGSQLTVDASANMATDFLGLIGYNQLTIDAESTAKWGSTRLRVALVLDNTGSMADDGKIEALRTATANLLTQLQNADTTSGDVFVSIIPFSKNVNLDSVNFTADWIDWTDWESEPAILQSSKPYNWSQIGPGSLCPFSNFSDGFQCTTGPANDSPATSMIPSDGSYAGYICPSIDSGYKNPTKIGIYYNGCYNSIPTTSTTTKQICSGRNCSCRGLSNCSCSGRGWGEVCTQTVKTTGPPYTHNWIANDHNTWNGCVTDRGTSSGPIHDYDRLVTAPTTSIPATLFPAEQNSYCSPTIMGLSDNWSAMSVVVDNLYPLGATNQPIGLVWGWQSLVGGGPLTAPAEDPNYTYKNVIILLSDGLNTLDRWYGNGSSTSSAVDDRMYDAAGNGTCANINAAGITLYTIQVNTGGDPTSTLLQNCAGSPGKFPDPDNFYLLTSADQIITAFKTIGTNLTKLRIAQ